MTREQFNEQRSFIKNQRKSASKRKSRKQLDKAMFKAKVGFIELFRAIGSLTKAFGILISFVFRDFVAFMGRMIVKIANKAHAQGHKMDWSLKDYRQLKNAQAKNLSHKRF